MGPPCPCPHSKKPIKKGTRGISCGPLLTPGPRAVPESSNGQSAPEGKQCSSGKHSHWLAKGGT
ncbi:unnamed protein product, partial [Staurois parvus]